MREGGVSLSCNIGRNARYFHCGNSSSLDANSFVPLQAVAGFVSESCRFRLRKQPQVSVDKIG